MDDTKIFGARIPSECVQVKMILNSDDSASIPRGVGFETNHLFAAITAQLASGRQDRGYHRAISHAQQDQEAR